MAESTFSWIKAIFIFLSIPTGFFITISLSRFLIPKDAGLSAGAMAVFYGLIGLIITLIGAIYLRNRLSNQQLQISSAVMGIFSLLMIGWIIFSVKTTGV